MSLPVLPPATTPAGPYAGPVPPICFVANASSVLQIDYNKWTLRLDAIPRVIYESGYQYDTRYLRVGQWYANRGGGYAYKITAISYQDSAYALCTVEDEEFFNAANYPTNPAQGPASGYTSGYVFEINEQGVPMITQVSTTYLPSATYVTDLQSAFAARNRILQYVRVYQPSNQFQPGNFVHLSPVDQLYHLSTSSTGSVYETLGVVTSYGFPYYYGTGNANYFSYAPFGQFYTSYQMSNNLLTPLPLADPKGTVYYVGPTGAITSTKPTSNAYPVWVKISTGGDAICLKGVYGLSSSTGGSGGVGPQGPTGAQGPAFSTLVGYSGANIFTSNAYIVDTVGQSVQTVEVYDMNYQGLQVNFVFTGSTGCSSDVLFAGLKHMTGTGYYIGFATNNNYSWAVIGQNMSTGVYVAPPTNNFNITEDGINVYLVANGVTVASVSLGTVAYQAGSLSNFAYYSQYLTGCALGYYTVYDWNTYTIASAGAIASYVQSGALAAYEYEWVNAQLVPPIHTQSELPLVLTPWHLSHIHTIVGTNTVFWDSLSIPYTGAMWVAMPYTNAYSQTGTTTPPYLGTSTGYAYPLFNAYRKRNYLATIPDNFTTNVTFEILPDQEVVLGIAPTTAQMTGWYNYLMTNRIQQVGANDWLNLYGTGGLGMMQATAVDIPNTDPVAQYNKQLIYTGQEYSDYYSAFASITGAAVFTSDATAYNASSSASLPLASLPAPERVIWPSGINTGVYNNVSYSQMAQAILYLRDVALTPFGSLTITAILNAYRALFVANPAAYLPLFNREYNIIVANPGWVLQLSPTPNNSLAYIMYYGS